MPKLYNSFCYADLDSVANSLGSNFFIGDGQVLQSVTILNADQLSLSFLKEAVTNTYTITVPDCPRLGFDNSFFGVSMQDSVDVTWLSAGILIAAWAIKTMRRGT